MLRWFRAETALASLEAAESVRVFGHFIGQEPEGNQPAKLHILGLIDHAHPATAQLLDDAIMRDSSPDRWRESYL